MMDAEEDLKFKLEISNSFSCLMFSIKKYYCNLNCFILLLVDN